jgi:hypothetical protein
MPRQAVAIALAGVTLLLAASPAQAARSEFFGVAPGPTLDQTDLATLETTGVKTSRLLISWKSVEPTRGHRDWEATDRTIGGLASQGIRGVPFVWGSPHWLRTGGRAQPPVKFNDERTWQSFLKAVVGRYGRGGSYWSNQYRQVYGDSVAALPVRSWQVWNEPNLRNEFHPGATVAQAARRYARLLQVSADAITSRDRQAEIITAGFATQKDPHVFQFIDSMYSVPGIKDDFDGIAQHPYASSIGNVSTAIQRMRQVMANHGDQGTPLWITESGWGSAPADGSGINVGPAAQAQMLTRYFRLILGHRRAWNVQAIYWFHWRDPAPNSPYVDKCIRCGSAGLLTHGRDPKPAFDAFVAFTAETVPPSASITGGPANAGLTKDPTPTFSFASTEAGSTFACRFDSGSFAPCVPPYTSFQLSQGSHAFSVKAIDAAGNEGAIVSRTFTVDSRAPAAPLITATVPGSPANANAPRAKGTAEPGSTVRVYKTTGCTGAAAAVGPASTFASTGLKVTVPDDTTTRLRAKATDAAGNTSACSAARTYVEDSRAPQTTISSGPSGVTLEASPTFGFASSQAGSTFECRFDSEPFAACSGPGASHTPAAPLELGVHTFEVRATDAALNTDPTPATRTFTVISP